MTSISIRLLKRASSEVDATLVLPPLLFVRIWIVCLSENSCAKRTGFGEILEKIMNIMIKLLNYELIGSRVAVFELERLLKCE